MSHAANLGRLEIIKAWRELGARDFQHAFDRAVLQGRIECARWLHEHGAKAAPGIIMGACETLNAAGVRFLLSWMRRSSTSTANRLAPLALGARKPTHAIPTGKHAHSRNALRNTVTTCPTRR